MKKARQEENEKLGGVLLNYFKPKEYEASSPLETTKRLLSKEFLSNLSQESTLVNVEKGSKSTDPNNLDEHAAVSDLNNDSVNYLYHFMYICMYICIYSLPSWSFEHSKL